MLTKIRYNGPNLSIFLKGKMVCQIVDKNFREFFEKGLTITNNDRFWYNAEKCLYLIRYNLYRIDYTPLYKSRVRGGAIRYKKVIV